MRAIAAGGLESIEAMTGPFWSLAPYGMVLLRLELRSEQPLRDALWVQSNPVARQLVPGAHLFAGMHLRELREQRAPFVEELLRWEERLICQGSLSMNLAHGEGEDRVVLHVDAFQRAGYLMVWLRDITLEQHELESTRRERDLMERVIHSASDAIYAKDLQGRYTLINPAGARVLGAASPAAILGRTDEELFLAEDAHATRAHDTQVLASPAPVTYEDEDLAGQRVWQSTKGALRDRSGELTGLFGISRDITERRRMERAVHESETRYGLVARATRDVIWDWSLRTGEMQWSTALGEVFGEVPAPGGMSLAWWRGHLHPEDQSQALRTLHAAMESGAEHWSSEYRFRRADGTHAHVLERGHIARDAEGRPERLIGAMMDVSERKQHEEERAREAQLLERLLGIVSHDLGSPLAAIRLSAQLLAQAPQLTLKQRHTVARIEDSTRRMSQLTQQLLDGVRARGGGIPVVRRPVALEEICRRVMAELAAIYPQRTVRLTVEGDSRGEWDADRLAQVLSNLVGNALEHGAVDRPVSIHLRDADGEQQVEVNNPGRPIPPEVMPVLFEPFRVGGRSGRRASGGGVGLGLFIVRELVRAHAGEVDVRSSAEEGTTFALRLPRHPPEAAVT